uniref:Uncharacterized protein n=2 Tax=Coptotermes formosanus TaxID=36987 RepID=R4UKK3_COPFO|nr:hypothetical protein [Coptotermes formosanus]
MTQALLSSRKRLRNSNCEEECCDFMPLSKRINNLHINNGNFCTSLGYRHVKHSVTKQTDIFEPSANDWLSVEAGAELGGNELLCHQSYRSGDGCHAAAQSTRNASSGISHQPQQPIEVSGSCQSLHPNSWISNNILSQYSPSLNASDNPYYYESNKLLFALYMERIHRNGDILY